jgi:competence protein ComEC
MKRRFLPAWAALGASALVMLFLVSAARQKPDGRLHVTFLDVDGANGVLIQTPHGGNILVDGGPFPAQLIGQLGDALPSGTNRLDALIVTAPQQHNIAALPELVSEYEIGALLMNGDDGELPEYSAFVGSLAADGTPITTLTAGYTLNVDDGVDITFLHAEDGLVLRVAYGEAVFLLTGEAQDDIEQVLLVNPHLVQATVLQVSDHGSGNASGLRFVETVSPQAAVIQIELRDPSPTVITRLSAATLFRTDQHGVVEFITDGHSLDIYAEESTR